MDQNEIGWADPQQFLTKLVEELRMIKKCHKRQKSVKKRQESVKKKAKKCLKLPKNIKIVLKRKGNSAQFVT